MKEYREKGICIVLLVVLTSFMLFGCGGNDKNGGSELAKIAAKNSKSPTTNAAYSGSQHSNDGNEKSHAADYGDMIITSDKVLCYVLPAKCDGNNTIYDDGEVALYDIRLEEVKDLNGNYKVKYSGILKYNGTRRLQGIGLSFTFLNNLNELVAEPNAGFSFVTRQTADYPTGDIILGDEINFDIDFFVPKVTLENATQIAFSGMTVGEQIGGGEYSTQNYDDSLASMCEGKTSTGENFSEDRTFYGAFRIWDDIDTIVNSPDNIGLQWDIFGEVRIDYQNEMYSIFVEAPNSEYQMELVVGRGLVNNDGLNQGDMVVFTGTLTGEKTIGGAPIFNTEGIVCVNDLLE